MKTKEIKEQKNLLILKHQLIVLSEDDLIELYNDEEYYPLFINTVLTILEEDIAFLVFKDEIINRIFRIISLKRDKLLKEDKEIINKLVSELNIIKALPEQEKNILKNSYLYYQEHLRKTTFKNETDFFENMAYDAYLLVGIENNNLEELYDINKSISSINYLLETIPELLQDQENYNIINNYLDSIKISKIKILDNRRINNTKKTLMKLKEE